LTRRDDLVTPVATSQPDPRITKGSSGQARREADFLLPITEPPKRSDKTYF
jgi:hypothetical protein